MCASMTFLVLLSAIWGGGGEGGKHRDRIKIKEVDDEEKVK